jgi:uncharacterized protein YdhG (YjbR/CyaY superfamily)
MARMKRAAQSKVRPEPNPAFASYIHGFAEPQRSILWRVCEVIRASVPADSQEVISYGVPAFALAKPFFGFSGFKHHLGLLPFSGSFFDSYSNELEGYSRTKSSLHLPYEKPLPVALIERMVCNRVAGLVG